MSRRSEASVFLGPRNIDASRDSAHDFAVGAAQRRRLHQDGDRFAVIEVNIKLLVAHLLAARRALQRESLRRGLGSIAKRAKSGPLPIRRGERRVGAFLHPQHDRGVPVAHDVSRVRVIGKPHGRWRYLESRLERSLRARAQPRRSRAAGAPSVDWTEAPGQRRVSSDRPGQYGLRRRREMRKEATPSE